MTISYEEAKALLDAYGELYHAAWYMEGTSATAQCKAMRDVLADAIAGYVEGDTHALDAVMGDVMGELGKLGVM